MKKQIHISKPLTLEPGYFANYSYDNYEMMIQQGVKSWKQGCPYQLEPAGLSGEYQIVQLCSMQIGYGERKGAAMYNVASAKDSLSIALIITCKGKSCFDRMKFREGDILFFDDSHSHNWITDGSVEHAVITIQKSAVPPELSNVSKLIGHFILDADARLQTTLNEMRKYITDDSIKKNKKSYQKMEDKILTVLLGLLSEQTPAIPKLTAGEKTALDIRDQVFGHMDGRFNIASLAEQHQISEQTLQSSFKSLFGFTPKRFLRLLKLNLVHQDLLESNPDETTVMAIAHKWGFMHMGRFSGYYTKLFRKNPSQTLRTPCCEKKNIAELCVTRQEEMN